MRAPTIQRENPRMPVGLLIAIVALSALTVLLLWLMVWVVVGIASGAYGVIRL